MNNIRTEIWRRYVSDQKTKEVCLVPVLSKCFLTIPVPIPDEEIKLIFYYSAVFLNPFYATGLFLYPLKNVFRGYGKRHVA